LISNTRGRVVRSRAEFLTFLSLRLARQVLAADNARVQTAWDATLALAAEAKSVVNNKDDLAQLVKKYRHSCH
jgi:phosphoglycerate dehydrogenase-like enzyme